MSKGDEIEVRLPRVQALALARIGELGLSAAEAFNLIPNTSAAERALAALKAACAARTKP